MFPSPQQSATETRPSAGAIVTRKAPRKSTASKEKAIKSTSKTKAATRPKLVWRKRDGQDSQLYNLKLDINDIKQEIARLAMMRSIVQSQTMNRHDAMDGSCQKMVVQYFEVFANGFLASPYDTVSYIYHAMSEDISVNNFCGRAMVVEQWKMHSTTFNDLDFRFVSASVIPLSETRAIVKCSAHFHATITLQTLAIMFPHILQRKDIVKKLVGKPISDFGRYDFEIDAKSKQITRCDVVLDFFSCFAKLLPDTRELAVLFGQALLFDEFYIRDADEPLPQVKPKGCSISELLNDEEDEEEDAEEDADVDATSSEGTASPASPAMSDGESTEAVPAQSKMRLDRILNDDPAAEYEATSCRAGQAY